MTAKEMTEIFSVMLLAWPNAETFKGGIARLGPAIQLWTVNTQDIDFWTGQQAVMRLCKECKYPPTIAEFRAAAESVNGDIHTALRRSWEWIRLVAGRGDDALRAWFRDHQDGTALALAVAALGGPDALTIKDGSVRRWNTEGLEAAYIAVIRKDPALIGGTSLALPGGRKESV